MKVHTHHARHLLVGIRRGTIRRDDNEEIESFQALRSGPSPSRISIRTTRNLQRKYLGTRGKTKPGPPKSRTRTRRRNGVREKELDCLLIGAETVRVFDLWLLPAPSNLVCVVPLRPVEHRLWFAVNFVQAMGDLCRSTITVPEYRTSWCRTAPWENECERNVICFDVNVTEHNWRRNKR